MRGTIVDDPAPHFFHHVAELDSRRTGRLTGAAIETSKHVLAKESVILARPSSNARMR